MALVDDIRAAVLSAWLTDPAGHVEVGGTKPIDQLGQLSNLAEGVARGVIEAPGSGGDHAAQSNLSWTASGHTGTAGQLAAFGPGGAAAYQDPAAFAAASHNHSGTYQPADTDLDALAGLSSTGLIARTGSGTAAVRTITQPAAGITVTNGSGESGNPTLALANDLAALEGLSGTGLARRTGTDAWSVGTTVATAEIADDAVTYAKIQEVAALSVVGNDTNATANPTAITAGSDHQVLRRSGASIGFGAVNLAEAAAVTGVLPVPNGGWDLVTVVSSNVPTAGTLTTALAVALTTGRWYLEAECAFFADISGSMRARWLMSGAVAAARSWWSAEGFASSTYARAGAAWNSSAQTQASGSIVSQNSDGGYSVVRYAMGIDVTTAGTVALEIEAVSSIANLRPGAVLRARRVGTP